LPGDVFQPIYIDLEAAFPPDVYT
jgi:hypothetical protein